MVAAENSSPEINVSLPMIGPGQGRNCKGEIMPEEKARFEMSLPPALRDAIRTAAKLRGLTMGAYVKNACAEQLARDAQPQANITPNNLRGWQQPKQEQPHD
jgi:hypothetical protein